MFTRFNGNVVPFADDSTSTNRTVFGGTTQSDLIDDNLNTNFKKGWEIVGLNDNPTREDFNAMGYTLGALTAYLYEMGISEWNASQNYRANSRVTGSDGKIYKSLTGTTGTPNVNHNPTSDAINWELEFKNFVDLINNQTIAGIKTFSSFPITPSSTPIADYQVANKKYVDNSIAIKTIATGTATFTATTNNINLTGIGIGVEIGDVIQISGAIDAKNNSEFTVEVITDANNVIVNQAHANKGTTKNVATRVGNTGVTVKLLAKWYNAGEGLGQGWVSILGSRTLGVNYTNATNRTISVSVRSSETSIGKQINAIVNSILLHSSSINGAYVIYSCFNVAKNEIYSVTCSGDTISNWSELR